MNHKFCVLERVFVCLSVGGNPAIYCVVTLGPSDACTDVGNFGFGLGSYPWESSFSWERDHLSPWSLSLSSVLPPALQLLVPLLPPSHSQFAPTILRHILFTPLFLGPWFFCFIIDMADSGPLDEEVEASSSAS